MVAFRVHQVHGTVRAHIDGRECREFDESHLLGIGFAVVHRPVIRFAVSNHDFAACGAGIAAAAIKGLVHHFIKACSDKGNEQHESSNHRDNQKKNRFFLLTHNANEFPGFKRQVSENITGNLFSHGIPSIHIGVFELRKIGPVVIELNKAVIVCFVFFLASIDVADNRNRLPINHLGRNRQQWLGHIFKFDVGCRKIIRNFGKIKLSCHVITSFLIATF